MRKGTLHMIKWDILHDKRDIAYDKRGYST